MRILLLACTPERTRLVRKALCEMACAIDVAEEIDAGVRLACLNEYDLAVVDGTPDQGAEACAAIRGHGKAIPIMIVSDDRSTESTVRLLESGADDYLAAPFALSEFMARIHALNRRPRTLLPSVLTVGELVLCTNSGSVRRGKRDIKLTRKEFMLLEYLMRHPGAVVTRAMILEHVWDMSLDAFTNTIETHIVMLRKKLAKAGCCANTIATVSGRGYRIGTYSARS